MFLHFPTVLCFEYNLLNLFRWKFKWNVKYSPTVCGWLPSFNFRWWWKDWIVISLFLIKLKNISLSSGSNCLYYINEAVNFTARLKLLHCQKKYFGKYRDVQSNMGRASSYIKELVSLWICTSTLLISIYTVFNVTLHSL
jgi:hypothetical protein